MRDPCHPAFQICITGGAGEGGGAHGGKLERMSHQEANQQESTKNFQNLPKIDNNAMRQKQKVYSDVDSQLGLGAELACCLPSS